MKSPFYLYLFLAGFLLLRGPVHGQVNFLGKPGYIATPSAEWNADRPLGLSFSYLPREYSLFQTGNRNTVNFYNARLTFTSFMEVNLSIAYRPLLKDRIGIGDRQLDFRFRLLKETAYRPSLILGWTPPGSRLPILAHDYLVATKNIHTSFGKFQLTAGYGSPYVFTRDPKQDNTFWESLRAEDRNEIYGNQYLLGFFGGLSYMPVKYGGLMLEYDGRTANAGAFLSINEWLNLQAYTYEAKEIAFHFAMHFPLNFAPRALRRYEKNLD